MTFPFIFRVVKPSERQFISLWRYRAFRNALRPGPSERRKQGLGNFRKYSLTLRQLTVIIDVMETKRYTIEELVERTGFSRRTIRYYVQEGLIDPPAGRGRGGFYFDSHLNRLLEIRSLQGRGMKLAAIRQILRQGEYDEKPLEREVWARYPVLPGVEIHILHGVEEHKRKELMEVIRAARSILTGNEKEDSHG